MQNTMTHMTKLVHISPAANYSSTAATTEWISMKGYTRCRFIIDTGAWAGGTAAVTLLQAINVAGSSSTALAFAQYYTGTGDTLTRTSASSNTFNLAAADTKYVIEITDTALSETTAGVKRDCVAIAIASPGSNADYYAVIAELYGARYAGNLPTAITN